MKLKLLLLCLNVLVIQLTTMQFASARPELDPGEVKVRTASFKPDKDFDLQVGRYEYSVKWQGLPVATAWIAVQRKDTELQIHAGAKTTKFIDLFYELRYAASEALSLQDLTPKQLIITQKENSREKETIITFSPQTIAAEVKRLDKNSKYLQKFNVDNFTLGPMSAALLARSLSWKPGQSRQFDVYNGKSRYLITFKCVGSQLKRVLGKKKDVLVFQPEVYNLSKGEPADKLRHAEIYITNDNRRDIVDIESEVFIGSISAELTRFTPSSNNTILLTTTQEQQHPG